MTSKKNNEKIGLIGGTFDPVHIGHLFIAQTALEEVGLDRVIFVPAGQPPHKQGLKITDSHDRIQMLREAIKNNSGFELSLCEIETDQISYTYDLLRYFIKNTPAKEIYFIMGADSFMEFRTWYRYQDLLSLGSFIVIKRRGYESEAMIRQWKSFQNDHQAKIYIVDSPTLEISSSDIRKRIGEGKSIRYIVPEPVREYIKNNNIYLNDWSQYD